MSTRRRLLPLVAVLVAVALVVWLFRPDAQVDQAAPDPATPADCLPTGPLGSVRAINEFVSSSPGVEAFQGGDVGVDVGLQDGRRLWLFADTLVAKEGGGQAIVRNSMLVFSAGCAEMVAEDDEGAVIPDRPDGTGYWPMSGFRLSQEGRDTVYVMVQRVRAVGTGLFAFEILGTGIAVFDVPRGGAPSLRAVHDLGPDRADVERPVWGAATVVDEGWVYLYGTSRRALAGLHGFALSVARVRTARLLELGRWRYWTGARWVADPGRGERLIEERGGVSQVLSVFEQDGRWFALSKRDDFLGDDMVVWSAQTPVGPFDDGVTVASWPRQAGERLTYMPLAHPEVLPRPGTMVVSWSRNSEDLADVGADPSSYRPRFRRVPLPG